MERIAEARKDHVHDAALRLQCQFVESVFYRCALEAGYGRRSEDKAHELMNTYVTRGYVQLDKWVKDKILSYCNMEFPKGGGQQSTQV